MLDIFRGRNKSSLQVEFFNANFKRAIAEYLGEFWSIDPSFPIPYEEAIEELVYAGKQHKEKIREFVEQAYKNNTAEGSDISGFLQFHSLEQTMLKNRDCYAETSIFLDGYVRQHIGMCLLPILKDNFVGPMRLDDYAIWLYPLPCKTPEEKYILDCAINFNFTRAAWLCSAQPLYFEEGTHVKIRGIPYFYDDASSVKIVVQNYEVIK